MSHAQNRGRAEKDRYWPMRTLTAGYGSSQGDRIWLGGCEATMLVSGSDVHSSGRERGQLKSSPRYGQYDCQPCGLGISQVNKRHHFYSTSRLVEIFASVGSLIPELEGLSPSTKSIVVDVSSD